MGVCIKTLQYDFWFCCFLSVVLKRNVDYGVLDQGMARVSEYFCEKAIVNGYVKYVLSRMYQMYTLRELCSVSAFIPLFVAMTNITPIIIIMRTECDLHGVYFVCY